MRPIVRPVAILALLAASVPHGPQALGQDPPSNPARQPSGDAPPTPRPPSPPPGGAAPARPARPMGLRAEMQAARREFELLTRSLAELAGELPPDVVDQAREVGAAFQRRVDEWREAHAAEFKELEERARSGAGLDAEALRAGARLRDSMPRLSELREGIDALLDERSRSALADRIAMHRKEADAAARERSPREPMPPQPRDPTPAAPPADDPARKGDGKPSGR